MNYPRYQPHFEQLEHRWLLAAEPMTAAEQHFHELINWIRAHPAEAAQYYGTELNASLPAGTLTAEPRPPLARNDALREAVHDHLEDQRLHNQFGHVGSDGSTLSQRIEAAGYTADWLTIGENIAWYGDTRALGELRGVAEELVRSLFQSPDHRINMLQSKFREAGSSLIAGPFTQGGTTYNAALAGQNFASQAGDSFLTGLACRVRHVTFDFCDVTQAISAATITLTRRSDGRELTTTTGPTGEYDIALPTGIWDARAAGGGLTEPIQISNIVMSTQNVKLDFVPQSSIARWQNPVRREDVDGDEFIVAKDALVIINLLNTGGARALAVPPEAANTPFPYTDPSGDNHVSPVDALVVINFLNSRGSAESETAFNAGPLAAANYTATTVETTPIAAAKPHADASAPKPMANAVVTLPPNSPSQHRETRMILSLLVLDELFASFADGLTGSCPAVI